MRDVNEVLREKESALERVAREVEILRSAIPLLTTEMSNGAHPSEMRTTEMGTNEFVLSDGRRGDAAPDVLPDLLPGNLPDDGRPGDVRPGDVRPEIPFNDPLSDRPQYTEIFSNGAMSDGAMRDDGANDANNKDNGVSTGGGLPNDEFEYRGFPPTGKTTARAGRPSMLGLESDVSETGESVEGAESDDGKVSSRLKRFTRPLVSFMAG